MNATQKPQPKIVNLGSLNIDHVYQVPHFVQPGETMSSSAYARHAGGKGLNQSIALARAGASVWHAGKIGSSGNWLREMLIDNQVNVDLLVTGAVPTGHAIIQVTPEGQNAIIIEGGANQDIDAMHVRQVINTLAPGDWLLLQNEVNALDIILKSAQKRGIQVAFNAAPITAGIADLPLSAVKLLFVNEIEGGQLSGAEVPSEILEGLKAKYPRMQIVLTLGSNGAIYADSDNQFRQAAFPVKAVDTTAAGDTFVGYFMAATIAGESPKTALKIASRAAAICVTRAGAAASIPLRAEVVAVSG